MCTPIPKILCPDLNPPMHVTMPEIVVDYSFGGKRFIGVPNILRMLWQKWSQADDKIPSPGKYRG